MKGISSCILREKKREERGQGREERERSNLMLLPGLLAKSQSTKKKEWYLIVIFRGELRLRGTFWMEAEAPCSAAVTWYRL